MWYQWRGGSEAAGEATRLMVPPPPPSHVEGLLSQIRGIGWDRVDSRDTTLCTSSKHRRHY